MSKRYFIVIPTHKEPYLKGFSSKEKAFELVNSKIGMVVKADACDSFNVSAIVLSTGAVKKKTLEVNDRATYFAVLPSAEDNIYGTAIIAGGESLEDMCDLCLETAEKILAEIKNL